MTGAEITEIVVEQCNWCSMNNARGVQTTYEDGAIDFRCEICGRTSRMGYTEKSNLTQTEGKRLREKAEENRSRYRREKVEQIKDYIQKQESPLGHDFINKAIRTIERPAFDVE